MNSNKAYDIMDLIAIKNTVSPGDTNILIRLSHHNDSEIRAYAAELLVLASGAEAESTLTSLTDDNDEAVRVNACDSLSAFPTVNTYKKLYESAVNDSSPLVRKFALLSLADIMNNINADKGILRDLFLKSSQNSDAAISSAGYRGLYMLGHKEYLNNLIELTKAENYQDRCSVVNILGDIIPDENEHLIISVLKNLRAKEQSEAVNSAVDKIIDAHCF